VYCWIECRSRDILFLCGRECDPHLMKTRPSCWSFLDANFNEGATLVETWPSNDVGTQLSIAVGTRLSFWCWDATHSCSWNAKIALDISRRGHYFNVSAALDACLAQIKLEIRAYLGHWRAYKRPGSFNSQFTWLFISPNQTCVWEQSSWVFLNQKLLKLSLIFIKDFHRVNGPKRQAFCWSSSVATAPTTMSGSPPQETPIFGK